MSENNNVKEKNNRKGLIALVILLIFLLCFCVYLLMVRKEPEAEPSAFEQQMNKIVEIPEEDRQAAVNQLVEENEVNISYLSEPIFDGDGVSKRFVVRNIENNHHPIVFEIYDPDDNMIFKSEPIEPGYEIRSIELDGDLDVGVHECMMKIGYEGEGNVKSVFPMYITIE